jgi:hypothetical protein
MTTDSTPPKVSRDDETPFVSETAASTSVPFQSSGTNAKSNDSRAPINNDLEQSSSKSIDELLWEEERTVREQVAKSPYTGNFFGAFLVNIYSAIHIVTVYLLSLESIISIVLSVSLTVCEYKFYPPLSILTNFVILIPWISSCASFRVCSLRH